MLSVTLSMMLTPDASQGSPLMAMNPLTGNAEVLSPGDAVRELNRRFQSIDDRYFTMIYGIYDTLSSTMRIAQAGHPGPILIRKDASPEILGDGGMPVGMWPRIEFDCFEVSVRAGDRLLLYSDGVTECVNQSNEVYGEERLVEFVDKNAYLPLEKLVGSLLLDVKKWSSAAEFTDDVSLLAIEVTEEAVRLVSPQSTKDL
jgi:sigma-B regulation protein RsbU (phosphoserine phosphatase)